MANAHYNKAAAQERARVKMHREAGRVAYRTPGSRGVVDVIVLDRGKITLEQLKGGGNSAWSDFGPAARERAREEARRAGADFVLVWLNRPGYCFEYPMEAWPA